MYQVWYFWSTNTKRLSNAPPKQVLSPIARFRPDRNPSSFLIFKISLWCLSAKSISSEVLLLNKHQKFVKCPMKTSFKPKLLVLGPKETQVWFLIFVISFWCVSAQSVSMWYFWSTNTKSLSNAPPKQVLSPIARFRPDRNPSFVFHL